MLKSFKIKTAKSEDTMIPSHFKFGWEFQNDDVTMHKGLGVWNGVTELGKNARVGTV